MVDAIALVLSREGTQLLLSESAAVQFVMDAFGHLKAIGYTPEAQPLLDRAGVQPDAGVLPLEKNFIQAMRERMPALESYHAAYIVDRSPGTRALHLQV